MMIPTEAEHHRFRSMKALAASWREKINAAKASGKTVNPTLRAIEPFVEYFEQGQPAVRYYTRQPNGGFFTRLAYLFTGKYEGTYK